MSTTTTTMGIAIATTRRYGGYWPSAGYVVVVAIATSTMAAMATMT